MAGMGKASLAVLAGVWLSCGVGVQMRKQIRPVIEALLAVFAFINIGAFFGWLVAGQIAGGRGNLKICPLREGHALFRTGRRILSLACGAKCGQSGSVSLAGRRTVAIGQRIWQWLRAGRGFVGQVGCQHYWSSNQRSNH